MKILVTLMVIFMVGCTDRQGGFDSNRYELVDKDGTVYFADHYLINCQDALAKIKSCGQSKLEGLHCRKNENYEYGMSVDNIMCGVSST